MKNKVLELVNSLEFQNLTNTIMWDYVNPAIYG